MIYDINFFKNILFEKKYPVSLIIFITNRCNARCSFCFVDFDDEISQNKKNELSVDEYRLISKNIGKHLQHIDLTGGEPFLRQDIKEIVVNFIDNCDLNSVKFSTNGSYPKKIHDFIENVARKHSKTKFLFQFSIDSFPEEHDRIRKIPGLFDRAIESYNIVKNGPKNCMPAINITITEENYDNVDAVYEYLEHNHKIETINTILVRDEGVYKIPSDKKAKILNAYKNLTSKITSKVKDKSMRGFSNFSIEGSFLNAKNEYMYKMISENYLESKFFTPCVAGSIFGVLQSDGTVHPCEILNKPMGNLRDYDFDFLKLWFDKKSIETKKWIKDTKCTCHWECIHTYNLISNPSYLSKLALKTIIDRTRN